MKKQTAVEFLWTKASSGEHLTPEDFEQAKSMERQQIIDAWDNGCEDDGIIDNAKQYYNETYKGGNNE